MIEIRRFAEIRARLDAGLDPAVALEGTEMDLARWRSEEEAWLLRLSDESERGVYDTLQAFEAAYGAVSRQLSGGGVDDESEQRQSTPDDAGDASERSSEKPAASGAVQETAEVDMQALRAAIPFFPEEVRASASPPTAPAVSSKPAIPTQEAQSSTGTDEIDMVALRQYVMPFGESPGSSEADQGDQTMMLPEGSAQSPSAADSPPLRRSGPAREVDPPRTIALPSPEELERSSASPHTAAPRLRGTPGSALPFAGQVGALMPVERFAEISASLTREGDPEATFARLGIDSVFWMATVRGYSVRFAEDPGLKTQFDALMAKALGDER